MIEKILILFIFLFLNFYSLKSQINDRDTYVKFILL